MWKLINLLLVILLLPASSSLIPQPGTAEMKELWLDVSIGLPLTPWFNNVARPTDIARIEHVSQLDLLEQITVGRKLLVFKSATEAEEQLAGIAEQLDIIGYNLEHGPTNPAEEQASPVESAMRMRALADEYGLTLAFGPDHDFALSHGVAIAPFVDIFVLQVQRAQTDPQEVYDFVLPLIPQLREANPELEITIQVRTEGDVVALADLIASMDDDLDGVSILTSPETVSVAEALVDELYSRMGVLSETSSVADLTAVPNGQTNETAVLPDQRQFIQNGALLILLLGIGMGALILFSRSREKQM